ncbi:hypothetical protein J31TS4_06130 [Paenibacillus sp. J31TS4]|nr:hypothetical protein J31TS4_06130 [Paenibacillus sp. J31TS4]
MLQLLACPAGEALGLAADELVGWGEEDGDDDAAWFPELPLPHALMSRDAAPTSRRERMAGRLVRLFIRWLLLF